MSEATTLFDRLGGTDGLTSAVTVFYRKVLADPRVARYFTALDMDRQIAKQVAFMTVAFGGTSGYSAADLTKAHAKLVKEDGLGHAHFDAIAEILEATLTELGIETPLIGEVMASVGGTRSQVLGEAVR